MDMEVNEEEEEMAILLEISTAKLIISILAYRASIHSFVHPAADQ